MKNTAAGRGHFIVIEGVDGAGKTTQIAELLKRLATEGKDVFMTAEPTCKAKNHPATDIGLKIQDALSGKVSYTASEMASLFLTDRIMHNCHPVWGIKKLLAEGKDIICDRYYYSSCAYQGSLTDFEWVLHSNLDCPDITRPDVCIFLDLDPKDCRDRVFAHRSEREIYEKDAEMLSLWRNRYLYVLDRLKDEENIKIVNAARPIKEVADEIFKIVTELKKPQ